MAGKTESEKEKMEWQLTLELQETRMLDGMHEICTKMGDSVKALVQAEMEIFLKN